MKISMILLLVLLAVPTPLCALESGQREETTPASPDDNRPNDPKVPDVYAVGGQFDRILVMRMKFGTDLLKDLQQMVKQEHIRNAVILSGIGSVRGYQVHQLANRDLPTRNVYTSQPNTPADLDAINGYVVDGKVHAHITLGTGTKAIAGHLEPGTEVFTYVIVTVGVMNNIDLGRVEDKTYR